MEDKEELDKIKKEHFIMRRVIERIYLMHERAIRGDEPLQERMLWLNINYAFKNSKARSTRELGIPSLNNEKENFVIFKVIDLSMANRSISENGDVLAQRNYWFQIANDQIDFIDWLLDNKLNGQELAELQAEYEKHLDKPSK